MVLQDTKMVTEFFQVARLLREVANGRREAEEFKVTRAKDGTIKFEIVVDASAYDLDSIPTETENSVLTTNS